MSKRKAPLEIRQQRIFSEELKKKIVKDLVSGRTTMRQVIAEHQVNRNSVYNWLYKYSPQHERKATFVVQMQSEETKTHELRQRVAELERIVGQKQLEIDFLNKLLEVSSEELGYDLKKKLQCQTLEWFRLHRYHYPWTMNSLFALCGISRQAHFQALERQHHWQQKALLYIGMMEQTREIHPGMGLRTMYEMLQPDGMGRDSFRALGATEGYQLQSLETKTRTTFSVKTNRYRNLLSGVAFSGQDQVWSSDITYFHCLGQFFYLVFIMDVYTRRIVGYNVAENLRAENNLTALNMALKCRGIAGYSGTLIHHSDKGGQYAADAYTDLLDSYGIRISMCKEVYENTHIERVNATIKNQYLNRWPIGSKKELERRLRDAVNAYNTTKPHQSIGKIPPVAYEEKLKTIPTEQRVNMKIYTVSKYQDNYNTNQLNLFEQLA